MPGSISQSDGWRFGEDKVLSIAILDAAGVAVDLTGLSLRFVLLRQHGDATLLLEKTSGDGIEVTGDEDNVVEITIEAPDDYDDIPGPGVYAGELWQESAPRLMLWPRPTDSGDCYIMPGTPAPAEEE